MNLEASLRSREDQRLIRLPKPMRLFLILNVSFSVLAIVGFCWQYFILNQRDLSYPSWCYWHYWPIGRTPRFPDVICFLQRFRYLHTPAFFTMDPRLIGIEPPFRVPGSRGIFVWHRLPLSESCRSLSHLSCALADSAYCALRKSHGEVPDSPARAPLSFLRSPDFFLSLLVRIWNGQHGVLHLSVPAGGNRRVCTKHPNVAAVLYGVAAGMKIFPFVFRRAVSCRKQYRQIGIAALVAGVLNVAGLWMVCPPIGFALRGISAGLAVNRQIYILTVRRLETSFDHSSFRTVETDCRGLNIWSMPSALLTAYLAVMALGGLWMYFARIRKLPLLNQITLSLYCRDPVSHPPPTIHAHSSLRSLGTPDPLHRRLDPHRGTPSGGHRSFPLPGSRVFVRERAGPPQHWFFRAGQVPGADRALAHRPDETLGVARAAGQHRRSGVDSRAAHSRRRWRAPYRIAFATSGDKADRAQPASGFATR